MSHFYEGAEALHNKGSYFVINRDIVCYLLVDLGLRTVVPPDQ